MSDTVIGDGLTACRYSACKLRSQFVVQDQVMCVCVCACVLLVSPCLGFCFYVHSVSYQWSYCSHLHPFTSTADVMSPDTYPHVRTFYQMEESKLNLNQYISTWVLKLMESVKSLRGPSKRVLKRFIVFFGGFVKVIFVGTCFSRG